MRNVEEKNKKGMQKIPYMLHGYIYIDVYIHFFTSKRRLHNYVRVNTNDYVYFQLKKRFE